MFMRKPKNNEPTERVVSKFLFFSMNLKDPDGKESIRWWCREKINYSYHRELTYLNEDGQYYKTKWWPTSWVTSRKPYSHEECFYEKHDGDVAVRKVFFSKTETFPDANGVTKTLPRGYHFVKQVWGTVRVTYHGYDGCEVEKGWETVAWAE
jgi:hypothetical protein